MKKIFVVGCGRSGTTLVQTLLGAHKDTYTLGETHYFRLIRRRGPKGILRPLDYLGLSQQNVLKAYDFICSHNELLGQYDPSKIRSLRSAILFFDEIMTSEAQARGKLAWVEKTPGHVFHIRVIKRYIPSAQFVHVIRDGRDVLASYADAVERFPEFFKKRHGDLERSIDIYNRCLKESLKYCGNEGHIFVQYEHILDDVEGVCHKLYTSLGLESENLRLLDLGEVHQKVVKSFEGWKEGGNEIRDTRLVKFNRIFDDEQKRLISSRVKALPPRLEKEII